ncbi:hypothetical protein [Amycolatopsis taiwanensis]|uniref:hypothetical protein n=1 Tax=Amycolatopsis taiwanensis TaxID=342230 RepID=UPI0004B57DDE|nr:hypothetical protein [Amycolatopsis taiwanensis]
MPYVYKNANTGDEASLDERSVRLDHLDNWSLVSEPEPASLEGSEPKRPTQAASKDEWVAWAIHNGVDAAEAAALTKPQLIERFGKDA